MSGDIDFLLVLSIVAVAALSVIARFIPRRRRSAPDAPVVLKGALSRGVERAAQKRTGRCCD